jgi:16S rRNA (guanine966-N2)-methyltransferase
MAMLAPGLEGARVLDLFAGSGAVGIEALSRGARSCDFVENNPAALHALRANVAALRVRDRARIFKRDAIQFIRRIDRIAYDIAFADPPYGSRKLDRVVKDWLDTPFSTLLAVEHGADHPLPIEGERRRVGDSIVTILRVEV